MASTAEPLSPTPVRRGETPNVDPRFHDNSLIGGSRERPSHFEHGLNHRTERQPNKRLGNDP